MLSPVLCAFSAGVASLIVGLSWVRAHSRGSWRSVGGCGLFLRFRRRTCAFSGAVGAGSGKADSSATLKTRRSPTSEMKAIVLVFGLHPGLGAIDTSLRGVRGADGHVQCSVGVAQSRSEDVSGP